MKSVNVRTRAAAALCGALSRRRSHTGGRAAASRSRARRDHLALAGRARPGTRSIEIQSDNDGWGRSVLRHRTEVPAQAGRDCARSRLGVRPGFDRRQRAWRRHRRVRHRHHRPERDHRGIARGDRRKCHSSERRRRHAAISIVVGGGLDAPPSVRARAASTWRLARKVIANRLHTILFLG